MFRPQIQKTRVLFILAILNLALVYWSLNSYQKIPTYGYNYKKDAMNRMMSNIDALREIYVENNINDIQDSLSFGDFLLGPQFSEIKTTNGSYNAKQSTLNPDFAAMLVEMLIELEVDSSTSIAVSYTGSYPGANIALLSALDALKVNYTIITSCGASEYGATNPNMTWVDIENQLFKHGLIQNKSFYASIGGEGDIGLNMLDAGRKVCIESIKNNNLNLLLIENRKNNIKARMNYYNSEIGLNNIQVFINIGGGIYTVGDSLSRRHLQAGIIYPSERSKIDNITIVKEFLNNDIPVLNINHINNLMSWYGLAYPPNFTTKYGEGSLYYLKNQYNPIIILVSFIIASSSVFIIGLMSHHQIKNRMYSSEPDSII